MSDQRKDGIAWTDATWNPLRGCSKVSAGCKHCYAETMAARFSGPGQPYEGTVRDGRWNGQIRFVPEKLSEPLRWRRPRRIFVNSMSDLFHEGVPFEYIAAVFGVMAACPQHTFQVLTKRPERAVKFFEWAQGNNHSHPETIRLHYSRAYTAAPANGAYRWPLPNVWLGVSVEDQVTADARIPHLLACPAVVRWVSYEPALGPVDFIGWGTDTPAWPSADTPDLWADFEWPQWVPVSVQTDIEWFWSKANGRGPKHWLRDSAVQRAPATGTLRTWAVDKDGWVAVSKHDPGAVTGRYVHMWNNIGRIVTTDGRVMMASGGSGSGWMHERRDGQRIDWIVVGGESGPNARPFDVAWARLTIAQCRAAGVPTFVKQMGSHLWDAAGSPWGSNPTMRSGVIRLSDRAGADPAEWPADLRVREWPAAEEGAQ